MKCINCNNDIPDGSSTCPVCGANLNNQPQTNAVPVDTSVLPVVPENPVLPVDQGTNQGGNQTGTPNTQDAQVTAPVQENVQTATPQVQQTEVAQTPVASEAQVTAPAQEAAQQVPAPQAQPEQVVNQNVGAVQATQPVTNGINPEFIQPNGDSVKLGNTLSPEDKSKKTKKNIIIIAAIVAVLLIIGIVFLVYYNSQYKSADKRIDAIVSALTMKTKSLKNDVIEKTSGSYDISLSVSSAEDTISAKVDGTYAVDLSGKAMDYTINLNSLNMGEELIDSPINLEFYLNESRIYVLLQNYFDSYIYDEVDGLSDIFDVTEQNNVNYVAVVNAFKNALSSSIKAMSSTQTVETVNIHGTSKKTNVIKINFNEGNRKKFLKTFINSLANNKDFVKEVSKFAEMSEDEFKSKLQEAATSDDLNLDINDIDIEIYTAQFGNELDGMKFSADGDDGKEVVEIYPTANGYGVSYKSGSQNVFDLTFEGTTKTTSTSVEETMKFGAVFYNEGQAYNINLDVKTVRDVNPKDAKINVKNSINRKYLTDEQKQDIITKAQSNGTVGLFLPSILSSYLGVSSSYGGYDSDYSFDDDYNYGDISITSPEGGYQITADDMTITDCTEDPSLCE